MHSPLNAVVLCLFTQVAAAQCADVAPATAETRSKPGVELIKTAAAGTHDAVPVARATPAKASSDDESPKHGSTVTLVAALALMSGIALRRVGTNT